MTPTQLIKAVEKLNLPLDSNIEHVYYYNGEVYRIDFKGSAETTYCDSTEFTELTKAEYKELRYDRSYINMTEVWKENSYAVRKKVGALFVKNNMIISDGFNGTPTGFPNECEIDPNTSHPYVMHAEQNAISKLAKSNHSSNESTLYVSSSPCAECSKQIMQSGVKRVVFWDFYRIIQGVNWMLRSGVNISYYNIELLNDIDGL